MSICPFKFLILYSNFDIEFSEAFDGEYEYLNGVRLLNINASRNNNIDVDYIFRIKSAIANDLNESSLITYAVNIGEFEYIEDNTEGIFLKSFSLLPKNLNIAAPLNISSNIILVGQDAVFNVTDLDGNSIENAEVFHVSTSGAKSSLGKTDENGILKTTEFSKEVVGFTVVAEHNSNISFEYKGQSFTSLGDETGKPYNIKSNGVKKTQK